MPKARNCFSSIKTRMVMVSISPSEPLGDMLDPACICELPNHYYWLVVILFWSIFRPS